MNIIGAINKLRSGRSMKIFGSHRNEISPQRAHSIQTVPQKIISGSDTELHIKIDCVHRLANQIMIAGWHTQPCEFMVEVAGTVRLPRMVKVARQDVATHMGIADGAELGFVLIVEGASNHDVILHVESRQLQVSERYPLAHDASQVVPNATNAFGTAIGLLASSLEPHTPEWQELIALAPPAKGSCLSARAFLEFAAANNQTGQAVIVGWALHTPATPIWLEDEKGQTWSLQQAYRSFRQDVHDSVGANFPHANRESGFIIKVDGVTVDSTIYIKAISETGVHILGKVVVGSIAREPVAAARWLFGLGVSLRNFSTRISKVDSPILDTLLQLQQSTWEDLPVTKRQLGTAVSAPKVSIIIPLYGRSDFVEHQLMEFSTDAWLRENAELIYVIDDPKLAESFPTLAEELYRLYQLPFCWVWGQINRGFSGANNLGVSISRAPSLLFLNSDAFPRHSGWLEQLLSILNNHPNVGAVGARLLFPDNSIQHASMDFRRREELGIWVNHHPHMGCDPALDPIQQPSTVTAVTGACIAMRKSDFDKIGGWDCGYLIGDFEDSDLCLKLRSCGLSIAYHPGVCLTHLERQSFKLLGQDEFRTKVVLYNAARHQKRWGKLLAEPIISQPLTQSSQKHAIAR